MVLNNRTNKKTIEHHTDQNFLHHNNRILFRCFKSISHYANCAGLKGRIILTWIASQCRIWYLATVSIWCWPTGVPASTFPSISTRPPRYNLCLHTCNVFLVTRMKHHPPEHHPLNAANDPVMNSEPEMSSYLVSPWSAFL